MAFRLGLTMRTVAAPDTGEDRDALAHDWAAFLARAVPEATWMPIPNLGVEAPAAARSWGLEGLILSGGNDIGASPLRDQTERALLDYFIAAGRPVFGVCRGLQMLQSYFGGALEPCAREDHVATRHTVDFVAACNGLALGGRSVEVNSFHGFGIPTPALRPPLRALAGTADGWTEACDWPGRSVMGVMWHPEREQPTRDLDRTLLRHTFGLDP